MSDALQPHAPAPVALPAEPPSPADDGHARGLRFRRRTLIGASLLFLLFALRYRNVVIDDPWITFRHGRNLAEGLGLAFNPGQAPVEGYSNPLWMLLSAGAHVVGMDPLSAARVVAVACALLMVGILAGLLGGRRRDELGRPLGFSPAGAWALAAMPAFGVSTMNGMETTSHALLFLLAVLWSAQAATRPGRWTGIVLGAVLLLGCLSRPEGPMILAAPAAAWAVATPRGRRALLLGAGIAGAGFIVFLVHRFSVFGALMPNTVTAKVGGSPWSSLWAGIVYTAKFLAGSPALLAALAAVMVARAMPRRWASERWSARDRALALSAGALIVLQVLFVLGVGGDWMPGWRFWVPVLPLMALLAGRIMDGFPFFVRFVLVGFLVLGSPFEASLETIQGYRTLEWGRVQSRGELLVEPLFRVGRELRAIVPEDATIALTEVGVIPYEARRDSLDLFGLTDAEIARVGGGLHESFDGALVLRRAPEFMLLVVRHDEGVFPPDRDLLARPEFHEQYVELRRWPRSLPVPHSVGSLEAWMVLYRRKD